MQAAQKIIENPENRLIEEAKKQIRISGYGALTIRSVAAACCVGTVCTDKRAEEKKK